MAQNSLADLGKDITTVENAKEANGSITGCLRDNLEREACQMRTTLSGKDLQQQGSVTDGCSCGVPT